MSASRFLPNRTCLQEFGDAEVSMEAFYSQVQIFLGKYPVALGRIPLSFGHRLQGSVDDAVVPCLGES
jgi:hypothetical protein